MATYDSLRSNEESIHDSRPHMTVGERSIPGVLNRLGQEVFRRRPVDEQQRTPPGYLPLSREQGDLCGRFFFSCLVCSVVSAAVFYLLMFGLLWKVFF